MKYTIENLRYVAGHEFGDDIVIFYFDAVFTEPTQLSVENYFCFFDSLKAYIQDHNPELFAYYQQTRTQLDDWGPAQGATFEVMGEAAVEQILHIVQSYLEQSDWVANLYEWKLRNMQQKPEDARKFETALERLSSHIPDVKFETQRSNRFKKEVSAKLREIAMQVYPEITEADSEYLQEFRHIFVSDIFQLEQTLNKFRIKISTGV